MKRNNRALLLLSGGYDSSALVPYAQRELGLEVTGLFIQYEQATVDQELSAMRRVAKYFKIDWMVRDTAIAPAIRGGYVPARNLVLISTAASIADGEYSTILYGAVAARKARLKEPGYLLPDTSDDFTRLINRVVKLGTRSHVEVQAPFVTWTKGRISRWLVKHRLRSTISKLTWSCWRNGSKPCGECSACQDRLLDRVD